MFEDLLMAHENESGSSHLHARVFLCRGPRAICNRPAGSAAMHDARRGYGRVILDPMRVPISSLPPPLKPPRRLRQFQIVGLVAQCAAVSLQVMRFSGMWQHARWVDGAAIAGMLIFLASVTAMLRWLRAQRKLQLSYDSSRRA